MNSSEDCSSSSRRKLSFQWRMRTNMLIVLCIGFPGMSSAVLFGQSFTLNDKFSTEAFSASLLGIAVLIFLNALFVASGAAVNWLRLVHLRAIPPEDKVLGIVQEVLEKKKKYEYAFILGRQKCRVLLIVLTFVPALSLAEFLAIKWGSEMTWGLFLLSGLLMMIPITLLNLVFGELVPKAYASNYPVQTIYRLHKFMKGASWILGIGADFLIWLVYLLTKRISRKDRYAIDNIAEEEIKSIVESAQQSGEIEFEEEKLIHSALAFADTVVRQVMTPRVDVKAVSVEANISDVIALMKESGFSRIPVYKGSGDHIIGFLHVKDLVVQLLSSKCNSAKSGELNLHSLVRPALFVPETKRLNELLTEMRVHRSQMAIIQDKYGGTAGIVTIEDIVEELVGEIVDEYDVEELQIIPVRDGYIVDGKLSVEDFQKATGSTLKEEEFDSIGGYVFGLFGYQPEQGESIEDHQFKFTVLSTDGRRIQKLKITPLEF